MHILVSWYNSPFMILLFIILLFAAMAGIVFLLRKFIVKKGNKEEEKKDEHEMVQEELDNFLETVEDEQAMKQFEELTNDNKEENQTPEIKD